MGSVNGVLSQEDIEDVDELVLTEPTTALLDDGLDEGKQCLLEELLGSSDSLGDPIVDF